MKSKRTLSTLPLLLSVVLTILQAMSVEAQSEKLSILDRILDISLRRAGVDTLSKEAELAKHFGKDWLNPFASDEQIRKDLERTRDHILNPAERAQIVKIWKDSSAGEDYKISRVLTIVHNASSHSLENQDKIRAALIAQSGHLTKTTVMGLPSHRQIIRDLVVSGSEQDLAELLKLQRNPRRYDILQIYAGRDRFPTEVVDSIKKWVHDGHVLWLPIVDTIKGNLGGERGVYFGLEFGIDVEVAESVKRSVEIIPYLAPQGTLTLNEDEKPIATAAKGEITTGVSKIRLKGHTKRSESNVRHGFGHTAGTYHATYIFYTFAGLDTPFLIFRDKPCMGMKKYGKGYVVCLQPYHNSFDAPRLFLNLQEWSAGYPVHKALVEFMQCPKCDKRYPIDARFCQDCGAKLVRVGGSTEGAKALEDSPAVDVPKLKPREAIVNSIGMQLKYIKPGEFWMGSPNNETGHEDDESPQHVVKLTKGFYIGVTEVTQAQWVKVMTNPLWLFVPQYMQSDDYPVVEGDDYPAMYISWDDAVEFCGQLTHKEGRRYRLPTEAEWEYACRAGTKTTYSFGDDKSNLGDYAWFAESASAAGKHAQVVGQKKPNPWGLYDMHGNVYEWCSDWHGKYPTNPVTDPKGPSSGKSRVSRGGSWAGAPEYCRSANRHLGTPNTRYGNFGFRIVLDSEFSLF